MSYVVLCIFVVAVVSQLSRLGELRYVPATVTSLTAAARSAAADAATSTHLFTGAAALNASQMTATTLLPLHPQGTYVHTRYV